MRAMCGMLAAIAILTAGPSAAVPPQSAPTATQTALYKSLMELNGVTRNVRDAVASTRTSVEAELLQKTRKSAFSPTEQARLKTLADAEFGAAEIDVINIIAADQAGAFTIDDLSTLIAANTLPAAKIYTDTKFGDQTANAKSVQKYMVDAVVSIINAYTKSTPVKSAYDDGNAAMDGARLDLARRAMIAEGSDPLIRNFVRKSHMRLVIEEVANRIDFSKLGDAEKKRLADIAASAQTVLEDRIVDLSARAQARALAADDLASLSKAMDNAAQKKLTAFRLADDGSTDVATEKRIQKARDTVASAFWREFPPPP